MGSLCRGLPSPGTGQCLVYQVPPLLELAHAGLEESLATVHEICVQDSVMAVLYIMSQACLPSFSSKASKLSGIFQHVHHMICASYDHACTKNDNVHRASRLASTHDCTHQRCTNNDETWWAVVYMCMECHVSSWGRTRTVQCHKQPAFGSTCNE